MRPDRSVCRRLPAGDAGDRQVPADAAAWRTRRVAEGVDGPSAPAIQYGAPRGEGEADDVVDGDPANRGSNPWYPAPDPKTKAPPSAPTRTYPPLLRWPGCRRCRRRRCQDRGGTIVQGPEGEHATVGTDEQVAAPLGVATMPTTSSTWMPRRGSDRGRRRRRTRTRHRRRPPTSTVAVVGGVTTTMSDTPSPCLGRPRRPSPRHVGEPRRPLHEVEHTGPGRPDPHPGSAGARRSSGGDGRPGADDVRRRRPARSPRAGRRPPTQWLRRRRGGRGHTGATHGSEAARDARSRDHRQGRTRHRDVTRRRHRQGAAEVHRAADRQYPRTRRPQRSATSVARSPRPGCSCRRG